jgi:uncharacterized protein with von Willebrand factor type A (vWA) domain
MNVPFSSQGRLRRVVAGRRAGDASRAGHRPIEQVPLRELRRPVATDERRELGRAVRRLVERIRLRASRRFARRRTGRPYLRSVFRESLSSGGVPFRIPRRRRRVRTPRVVLLIDVSWSTATAAGLFLSMAGEFLRLGRQARIVLFVDRPVEATAELDAWLERSCTPPFVELLRSLPGLNLDAPSDYGRLFHALLASGRRPRGRRTLLVVLGDGRTNVFDPLAWAFAELACGCGAALWLVPESRALWGTGDSALRHYAPHVDTLVEAADLAGLARGVAALVRRL